MFLSLKNTNLVTRARAVLSSLLTLAVLLALLALPAFAQETTDEAAGGGENTEGTSENEDLALAEEGKVKMETILVTDFEDAELWYGGMGIDEGLIQVRKIQGAAKEVRDATPEKGKYVLGTKIQFLRRTFSTASMEPPSPMPIPGITKKLTVWVNGRDVGHTLSAIVKDLEGRLFKVSFGKLNFRGWKKLEALIPQLVVQENNAYSTFYQRRGITFMSFFIEFEPLEAVGSTYLYLDNFSAESNMFLDEQEEKNLSLKIDERYDPVDDW